MNLPHKLAPVGAVASPLAILVVDGGQRIGFGHVGRCLAIWEELGGRAVFAVEDADVVRVLTTLGAPLGGDPSSAPVALIDRRTPTGAAEVERLQAQGQRVCLLDDPGAGRDSADLVVDPPTGASWPPAGGRRLAGFEYVLLRRDMRAAASTTRGPGVTDAPALTDAPPRDVDVLLAMGGSDPEGLTPVLAQALDGAGIKVTSVPGPAYHGPRPPGAVLADPRAWPAALAGAGLLVGRFGHTLLEAAHLGTPALALTTDERTTIDARAFAAHGTCASMQIDGPGDAERVAARVLALCEDRIRLAAMAVRGRSLVDGLGAARVATALRELA
jgi:spore coat polysaccharide biosynthesis predicted glycosyltransferase SpsG